MVIRFNKIPYEEVAKMLNSLPKDEYDLIAGVKVIITDSEYNKALKTGYLQYNGINVDVSLVNPNADVDEKSIATSKEYIELSNHLAKDFIHSKDIVDALYPGLVLNKNVLLYGRGGHGKSEMTEAFLDKALDLKMIHEMPFVQAFGEGLTEEALFGGLDMKVLKDTGEYLYLVENSFMNYETVVFEELFDAAPQILLSLKDIITSGWFRKGKQMFKIRTKRIIGLTNKSKEDFSEDDSLEAFVQRFPITTKVEWESYSKRDFIALFEKRLKSDSEYYITNKRKFTDLANIIELNNTIGSSFVSPRTAVQAAELYAFGSDLKLISDLDKEVIDKYFKENKEDLTLKENRLMLDNCANYLEKVLSLSTGYGVNEVEDEVLEMLAGSTVNFGIKKKLSVEDEKRVGLYIKKITWLEEHLRSNSVSISLEHERVSLAREAQNLKTRLTKILD